MLGATVVFLVAVLAYGAWSAYSTRSELLQARDSAEELQTALVAEDTPRANRAVAKLQQHFSSAHQRTDGPLWSIGSRLPIVGDDAAAVRTVAAVGHDVSTGTLPEVVAHVGSGLAARLVPRGGRIDIAAIESLAPMVARAHRDVNEAAGRLSDTDSSGLTRWVRPAFDTFTTQVQKADSALTAADRAAQVLPTMLGKDGPRTYMVIFNNNAEIRATGGLPGAYSVITADRGRVALQRQGAGAQVPQFDSPVLPQSPAERAIYADQIAEYFIDTNFTPEFPRTAELIREMWRRHAQQKLDGVLSLDAVSLSYLLKATGPIAAPGGVQLTSENAAAELLNSVYFRLPENAAQDEFFEKVAGLVFDKVVSGVRSPSALVSALGQGAGEGRLYVHDFDPATQKAISGSAVAGELTGADPRVPQVGVYLNDATGSKMSYYLRTKVNLQAESCVQDEQQLAGTADLTYTTDSPRAKQLPPSVTGPGTFGTPKGEQLVLVRIYGPRDGELSNFRVAGQPTQLETVRDRGRPVATTVVQLRRGDTIRVSWRVRSGPHQDRPAELRVSPGMLPEKAVRSVDDQCGSEN